MELNFSNQELIILKDICEIQISSYYDILRGNLLVEDEVLLITFQSSISNAKVEAKYLIEQYSQMKQCPQMLGIMSDSNLSTMRHILFHMEEEYMKNYPLGVRGLWNKFFTIEQQRKPEIALLTRKINSNGKNKEGGNPRSITQIKESIKRAYKTKG